MISKVEAAKIDKSVSRVCDVRVFRFGDSDMGFWRRLIGEAGWQNLIDFFGSSNNFIGPALGSHKKFIEWADENHLKIEKLEFTSFLEAEFSYWDVPRSHSCVKAVVSDNWQVRKGVYLMTGLGQPAWNMTTKFVEPEAIIFRKPFIIGENNKLISVKLAQNIK